MQTKVIRLYRGMMRFGAKLELTDHDYYRQYVRPSPDVVAARLVLIHH